jgi:hypothetical protein
MGVLDAFGVLPLSFVIAVFIAITGMPYTCRNFARWSQVKQASHDKRSSDLLDCGPFDAYPQDEDDLEGPQDYCRDGSHHLQEYFSICKSGKSVFALAIVTL